MKFNVKNKTIWDRIFGETPNVGNNDGVYAEVISDDGTTKYEKATPIGYDDEQKTYNALKEIIESAIKDKDYLTYKISTDFVDSYMHCDNDGKKEEILPYDVIYLFSESWEEPLFPVLVREVDNEKGIMNVMWLGGEDNEEILTETIKRKKSIWS